MRLRQLGVARKRRLVRGDRPVDVARVGELHAALQHGAGVFPQGRDRGEHRIDQRRPARADTVRAAPAPIAPRPYARVLDRTAPARSAPRPARGRASRRGSKCSMAASCCPSAAAMRPSPTSAAGLAAGSSTSAQKERLALLELAGFEQRLGELDARRQIVGRQRQRFAELRGRVSMPREPLQDDGVEVAPFERTWRDGARPAHTPREPSSTVPTRAARGQARQRHLHRWDARRRSRGRLDDLSRAAGRK